MVALRLFAFIGLAVASTSLFAQHAKERSSGDLYGKEPLEEGPTDPPMRPSVRLYTAAGRYSFGPYVSVQVNVGVNGNIVGDAANEPSLAVDPSNPMRIAVGWRQFDNVASNFRQAGWAYTTDGGATWTFPGVLQPGVFRSDPVLGVDASGKLIYLSLLESFFDDLWSSNNGGASWSRLADALGGDKQWMVVDRTNSAGRGNIYQIWSTAGNNWGGRQFTRSTNGGLNWMDPINIPNQPIWGTPDVNNAGTLYIGGQNGGTFWMIRSSNAWNAAVTPTFDMTRQVPLGGSIISGGIVNPGGLGGQSWMVVDKSNGPTAGNVYMLCSVRSGTTNPCDVRFNRSTDGGNTWGTSVRINDDPTGQTRWHWFGTLSVAPNGRLDATWYDTRHDATNATSRLYYSYSYNGGTTWAPNIQISQSFNQSLGYPNQNKIGDYMGMISDNYGADVAYAATFNGEQDVYYVRIPAIPVTIAPTSYTLLRGALNAGTLASLTASDDQYLAVRPGPVLSAFESPVSVRLEGTSSTATPTRLRFNFEARASESNLGQRVEMLNVVTGVYDTIDARAATTTDSSFTVTLANPSNYIDPVTRKVTARLSWKPTGPILSYPWLVRIDQATWDLLP